MALIDFGIEDYSQRAAAVEHQLAVTRDYISQPRLSETGATPTTYWYTFLFRFLLSLQDSFRS